MPSSIFLSWQADTPNRGGRTFLKDVLDEVCLVIAADTTLDEASRDLVVDSDTQGIAGQPPIVETIFKKIDAAAVFVADMTFTGKRTDGHPTPNPNVLIEYGWALKSLGSQRIVCVMNAAYGEPSRDTLPFDLAHLRWPITYSMAEHATPEAKKAESRRLVKTLNAALVASLATVSTSQAPPPPAFPAAAAKNGPARFRSPGEPLGFEDDGFGGSNREVYLAEGAAMWLRLFPLASGQKLWATREIREQAIASNSALLPLISGVGSYSYLRDSDGMGMYGVQELAGAPPGAPIRVKGVVFVFRTGEVWGVDTALLAFDPKRLFSIEIEKALTEGTDRFRRFLARLGITDSLRWKAGIVGARGRRLRYPPAPGHVGFDLSGPTCATDLIEAEGTLSPGEHPRSALLPFFGELFEECGVERPDYLPR